MSGKIKCYFPLSDAFKVMSYLRLPQLFFCVFAAVCQSISPTFI